MPTRNVNLTVELDHFVASMVETGRYSNASEVMRSALRMLEQEERRYQDSMALLRQAIQEGMDSGIAEPGVFGRLRSYIDEAADQEEQCRRTA
ncbi:MAG TPA: type II toxin-antitoxin system ParD family antitoxin [Terracidiphilus sp.]|jgi:antitoxin ParD1/3/4|nr:type II toxin-antitoxin system ParD family antitoxin [Terracidiphilus sp.]